MIENNNTSQIVDEEINLKMEIINIFIIDKLETNDDIIQHTKNISESKEIFLNFTVESLLLLSEVLKHEISITTEKMVELLEEIEINNDLNNYDFNKTLMEVSK